jgi:putative transcriptional regulator
MAEAMIRSVMVSLTTIEPGFLLAAPTLGDPNFEGTVVLLGIHDEEDGSLGWTVNGAVVDDASSIVRATGFVEAGDELPEGFSRPALRGGPVSPESVWILYARKTSPELLPGSIEIGDEIAVTATASALRLLLQGKGPTDFRLLVGYAGWGPGQLARELSLGAWLPAEADAGVLFKGDTKSLWRRAYERAIGSVPAAFVSRTARGGSAN